MVYNMDEDISLMTKEKKEKKFGNIIDSKYNL